MNSLSILLTTAFSIGFVHTILGVDHYLPFVSIANARNWRLTKLIWVTLICGIGHVLSSVFLGYLGIGLGTALSKLEFIESFRGDIAGWLLLAFGLVYFIYGIFYAKKEHTHEHTNSTHRHTHAHSEAMHAHSHDGQKMHIHAHSKLTKKKPKSITPWALFIIFLLGPCEPLIPLLMYPAAAMDGLAVVLVSITFGLTTIITMLAAVIALYYGSKKIKHKRFEKYTHALAGFFVFACGIMVTFIGL